MQPQSRWQTTKEYLIRKWPIIVTGSTIMVGAAAFLSNILSIRSIIGNNSRHTSQPHTVMQNVTNIHGNQINNYLSDKPYRRILPQIYLDQLPKIKYLIEKKQKKEYDGSQQTHGDALHEFYGADSLLKERLYDLAELAYTPEFFGGKSAKAYYDDLIEKLSKANGDSKDWDSGGTILLDIEEADYHAVIDQLIVQIVEDITVPAYFIKWKTRWKNADKYGWGNEDLDLLGTDKI